MALMPVADALNAVLDGAAGLAEEQVGLDEAFGRVLARDLAALRTQPPDDMSAMDGYAVRAADATLSAKLKVIGEVAAGRPFARPVQAGEAVRIFTGGVIPNGADAVVIQEDTTRDGDLVTVNEAASPGKHIRRAGIDFRAGQILLKKSHRLLDRDLALAASMNHATLPVHRKPKVALFATGDELVMPGNAPAPGQIVYSNGYALRALTRHEGADVIDLGIARDTVAETAAAIRQAIDAGVDILVTTGGASVGEHDVVQQALQSEGVEIAFWKIAMRPGKPMMHGRRGALRVLGLPGNPVSSYVCAILFLAPLIRTLTGRTDTAWPLEDAVLGTDTPANDLREDYLRASLQERHGAPPLATPVGHQDSSLLANLSRADALIIRPPHAPAATAGAPCRVLRLPS
ncbi:gephyrin-like molybdotransferase Glp [Bradyrhizobium sp. LHD-71]|uniref:molybdopterin molybdotransferase MoeA n=1 Tax=Bradyrhizobium sp. LHD-71 TaxID=3072141 RepID=UPI00280D1685|nr:gephyrin-like molybdotransferase Glp [Bradyrhizobium sp. LHD-71]MDQ8728779.1 molybdopterin molybdotransferase MoeA [Bradyrhizobium sp. LHD-71]